MSYKKIINGVEYSIFSSVRFFNNFILMVDWGGSHGFHDLDTCNHNVFMINHSGEFVWQVRRDDSVRGEGWWDVLHAHAREIGEDGARRPFTYFVINYPDGGNNINPDTGSPPDHAIWTPGATIWLMGSAYQKYILDPETGIATNVTQGNPRPW